jgi:hypothetical protein
VWGRCEAHAAFVGNLGLTLGPQQTSMHCLRATAQDSQLQDAAKHEVTQREEH